MILNKTQTGNGTGGVVTLTNAGVTSNVANPQNFVPYYNNPILDGYSTPGINPGSSPLDTPYVHGDPNNATITGHKQNNVYAAHVVYNPTAHTYEMYYGGWDRKYNDYNGVGDDWIYLATNPDPLGSPEGWTKVKVVLSSRDAPIYEPLVNDPCVVDCPDWNIRVMAYTGFVSVDNVCIATAPMGSSTFTKYSGNPVVAGTYGGNNGAARPSLIFEGGKLRCWFDYENSHGYCEMTYSGGVFTVTHPHSESFPSLSLITTQPFHVAKIGSKYYGVAQGTNNWWSSVDGYDWTELPDWQGTYPLPPYLIDFSHLLCPQVFVDTDGVLKAIYWGNTQPPYDYPDHNQQSVSYLCKSLRLYDGTGTLVKSSAYALNSTTTTLDVSGLSFPYSGTLKLVDENNVEIDSLAVNLTAGDVYNCFNASSPLVATVDSDHISLANPPLGGTATIYERRVV